MRITYESLANPAEPHRELVRVLVWEQPTPVLAPEVVPKSSEEEDPEEDLDAPLPEQ